MRPERLVPASIAARLSGEDAQGQEAELDARLRRFLRRHRAEALAPVTSATGSIIWYVELGGEVMLVKMPLARADEKLAAHLELGRVQVSAEVRDCEDGIILLEHVPAGPVTADDAAASFRILAETPAARPAASLTVMLRSIITATGEGQNSRRTSILNMITDLDLPEDRSSICHGNPSAQHTTVRHRSAGDLMVLHGPQGLAGDAHYDIAVWAASAEGTEAEQDRAARQLAASAGLEPDRAAGWLEVHRNVMNLRQTAQHRMPAPQPPGTIDLQNISATRRPA